MTSPPPPPANVVGAERETMEAVWAAGGEVSVREVLDALNAGGGRRRAYTTVMTMLTRLHEKGCWCAAATAAATATPPRSTATPGAPRAPAPRSTRSSASTARPRSSTSPARSTASTPHAARAWSGSRAATTRTEGQRSFLNVTVVFTFVVTEPPPTLVTSLARRITITVPGASSLAMFSRHLVEADSTSIPSRGDLALSYGQSGASEDLSS